MTKNFDEETFELKLKAVTSKALEDVDNLCEEYGYKLGTNLLVFEAVHDHNGDLALISAATGFMRILSDPAYKEIIKAATDANVKFNEIASNFDE